MRLVFQSWLEYPPLSSVLAAVVEIWEGILRSHNDVMPPATDVLYYHNRKFHPPRSKRIANANDCQRSTGARPDVIVFFSNTRINFKTILIVKHFYTYIS